MPFMIYGKSPSTEEDQSVDDTREMNWWRQMKAMLTRDDDSYMASA